MIKPDGILFDLDDTILAFSDASMRAWSKCCDNFVADHKVSFDRQNLFQTVTTVRKWYWSDEKRNREGRADMKRARREVFQIALKQYGFTDIDAINKTADSYSMLQEELWSLFPGVPESLQKLKDHGIKLAIVTNGKSEYQRRKIQRFHLDHYFDEIIIDTETGFSKPDIEIFRTALCRLGLPADRVWMIGDHLEWDVGAPQKIGITGVWNNFNRIELPPNSSVVPDYIVDSIESMTNLILTKKDHTDKSRSADPEISS